MRGIQGRPPYKENVSKGFLDGARRAARGAASEKEPPGGASLQGAGTPRYKHADAPRKSRGVTRSRVQGGEAGEAAGAALRAVVARRPALPGSCPLIVDFVGRKAAPLPFRCCAPLDPRGRLNDATCTFRPVAPLLLLAVARGGYA